MITRLSHTSIFVLDQDSAHDFYTNKLGFKVIDDIPMGKDTRWLTVSPPEQPNLEIILFPITIGKMFPEETANTITNLVRTGKFGSGVFECTDIYATYEELKAKGVEFIKAPTKNFMESRHSSGTIPETGFPCSRKVILRHKTRRHENNI